MLFLPEYPLRTDRLLLRPFIRGDVDAVHAYRSREDVARYLLDGPLSREECALAVQHRTSEVALRADGDRIVLAVDLARNDTLIGEISLILRNEAAGQAELGWIFDPQHHGHGYATEAAAAMLDLAFHEGGLHRVYARCDVRNAPSWRLMQRLGMRREAHFREHMRLKGDWDEEFYYAILEREWREAPMARRSGLS